MGNRKKTAINEPRTYTLEEIEEKLKTAEGKIQFIQRRISRIIEICNKSTAEYNELLAQKQALEKDLKNYTGFFSEIKHSLKSVFSGKENEAKRFQKQIGSEIEAVDKLIDAKLAEIASFEEAIASNEVKIEQYKKDVNKWQNKKKKREANDEASSIKELAD